MKKSLRFQNVIFLAIILVAMNLSLIAQPSVTVLQPNGLENWVRGNTYLISWTSTFTLGAKIDLLDYTIDPNNPIPTPIVASVQGSTYSWYIDPAIFSVGIKYKIRVSSVACGGCYSDVSNAYFSIVLTAPEGLIHVEQPNVPSIVWVNGTTNLISWTNSGSGLVNIKLYKGGTAPANYHSTLAENIPGSTYLWTIGSAPNVPPVNAGDYYIRVSSVVGGVVDFSDAPFAIAALPYQPLTLYQPNSATMLTWLKGSTYMISWNGSTTYPVKIELWKGAGVVAHTEITPSFVGCNKTWTITPTINFADGNDYRIRVTRLIDNVFVEGLPFSIMASPADSYITLLQPNAPSITWIRGNTHLISWIDNIPEPVNIYLTKGGGAPVLLKANAVGSTWLWPITNIQVPVVGGDFKIFVISTLTNAIVNPAGLDFSIQDFPAGGGIEILQPNVTGIKLLRGTQYLISWIGSMTYPVKIELVKGGVLIPGGFLPGNPTSASIVGSTFIWTIDPTTVLDDDYRIRITRLGSPVIADESAEEFEITNSLGGTIEVLNPMGGEFWYIGNSYLLSWNDNLAESVNIDLYETDETTPKYNIATNVPGTTHIWNTTGHLPITGGSYKIKVSSSLVPSIKDFSAAFTLACLPLTFTVYPNPASNYVTIKFDESADEVYTYQLKDRFNMTLLSNRVDAVSDKEVQITTAQLPNGVYFLTVTSDKTKTTQKIMIQH